MSSDFATGVADAWATALRDPARPLPQGLRTWNGSDPAARFDVYRNNVTVTLVAALADSFPVVHALVGDAFFAELARRFVRAAPPRSPVLTGYGATLPDFIAAYGPAAVLPYLPDVARLEHAHLQAFHAADAPALPAERLAARLQQPDALPGSRWPLHPSLWALVSAHPLVDLWAAHQGHGAMDAVDLRRPQAALLGRAGDDVLVLAVPPACVRFVAALQSGATLAVAVSHAGDELDLPATLALLLSHGWLSDPLPGEPSR